jgi:hypothetical protein
MAHFREAPQIPGAARFVHLGKASGVQRRGPRVRANVAEQTIANFIEKASRLYEQERRAVSVASALEMYVRRWLGWAIGGMKSVVSGQQHTAGKRVLITGIT